MRPNMHHSTYEEHAPVSPEALRGANPWLRDLPVLSAILEGLIGATGGFAASGEHRAADCAYALHEELEAARGHAAHPEALLALVVVRAVRPDVAGPSELAAVALAHGIEFEMAVEGISARFRFRPPRV